MLAVAAWLGMPTIASAQFQVTTAEVLDLELEDGNTDTSNSRYTLNIRDCATAVEDNQEITFRWTFNVSAPSSTKYAIKLQPPGATCTFSTTTIDGDQENCRLIAASDDLNGTSVSLDITIQNLLGFSDSNACLTEGVTSGEYIMGIIYTNPNDTTAGDDANDFVNEPIEVTLRLSRPDAPTLDEVSAGESTLSASWTSNVESIDEYLVFYSTTEFAEGTIPEAVSGSTSSALATSIDISSGLSVNRTYYVGVVNVDEYGNRSPLSNVLDVQTAPTLDFFEEYLSAGGVEQGGYCSAAPPGDSVPPVAALVLLTLFSAHRRSRRHDGGAE
jgi:MYXO-CTERM domain-containing protein